MRATEVHDTHALYLLEGARVMLPPRFYELRPHQVSAIEQIWDKFREGTEVVMVDAPTGAGKTVIGEFVRQLVAPLLASAYVCTTKGLQDQFIHEFPYGMLLKGRANYPTLDEPERFPKVSGADCSKIPTMGRHRLCDQCQAGVPFDQHQDDDQFTGGREQKLYHCQSCHPWQLCPYRVIKEIVAHSKLAVINTAYLLSEQNFAGRFGANTKVGQDGSIVSVVPHFDGMTIIDEADTLESVLMSTVSLALSHKQLRTLGLAPPAKKTVVDSWIRWSKDGWAVAEQQLQALNRELSRFEELDQNQIRERRDLTRLVSQMEMLHTDLSEQPDHWVYSGERGVEFKPIDASMHGPEWVWQHVQRGLLMSATLISPEQLAADLGLNKTWDVVRVDSHFPVERRRVVAWPRASMSYKTKETSVPEMVSAVGDVVDMTEPNLKVLVHAVSYELTDAIVVGLKTRFPERLVFTYRNGAEREHNLMLFREASSGVMVAPSLDRGVDLPDDDVRVIVIAKVPFPHLGDKQVSARFYGKGARGRSWYATETIRSIVQMTGRGMRHQDDWVLSYILDSQFVSNVWRQNRHLVPRWWSEALVWQVGGGGEKNLPEMTGTTTQSV